MACRAERSFKIRFMDGNEMFTLLDIFSRHSLKIGCSEVENTFSKNPKQYFVAVDSDENILGTCCDVAILPRRRLISGITVDPNCPHPRKVAKALLRHILSRYLSVTFDINLPETLNGLHLSKKFYRTWDIHLYVCRASDLKLIPLDNENGYYIYEISEFPSKIYITNEGMDIEFTLPKYTSDFDSLFTLMLRERTVGFGCIRKAKRRDWILGPVIAHEQNAAKYILETIFMYHVAKFGEDGGMLFAHVLSSNETGIEFLRDSGFCKDSKEWTRYASTDSYEMMYEDVTYISCERMIFSLGSVVFTFH